MCRLLPLLFLLACGGKDEPTDSGTAPTGTPPTGTTPSTPVIDADGDGHAADVDCDDNDDSAFFAWSLFVDGDGDGIGAGPAVSICGDDTPPAGYALADGDCNDTDPGVHPGAAEVPYDGIDQDCDSADLDDVDGDTHAFPADCDDTDPTIHPAATDSGGDAIDDDCSGDPYDLDGDGDDDLLGGDCDDDDPARSSLLAEVHDNGIDDDCDPTTVDVPRDQDGDGVSELTDCDDLEALAAPGLPELPDDGIDNDCNGSDLVAADGVGIYVDKDDPSCATGTGSLASPVCNIDEGISASAGFQPIFVAGGLSAADRYFGSLMGSGSFELYGGYESATWTRVGRTHVEPASATADVANIGGTAHIDRLVIHAVPSEPASQTMINVGGELWFTDGEVRAEGVLNNVRVFHGNGTLYLRRSTLDLESPTLAVGSLVVDTHIQDSVIQVDAPVSRGVDSGDATVVRSAVIAMGPDAIGVSGAEFAGVFDSDVLAQTGPAVQARGSFPLVMVERSQVEVLDAPAYGYALHSLQTAVVEDSTVLAQGAGVVGVRADNATLVDVDIDITGTGIAGGVTADNLTMHGGSITVTGVDEAHGIWTNQSGEVDRVRVHVQGITGAHGATGSVHQVTNTVIEVTDSGNAFGLQLDVPAIVANSTIRTVNAGRADGIQALAPLALVSSIVELEATTNLTGSYPVAFWVSGLVSHSNVLRHDGHQVLVSSLFYDIATTAAEIDGCSWGTAQCPCYPGSSNWNIDPGYANAWQLGPTSPMLGAGIDPATIDYSALGLSPFTWPEPPTDIDGDPRVYWDIGANERVR